ncbi:porin family protein [Marinobacter changyiensis]|uniref:porin family protein n=1 Tax=Marinobacter changyiensis TaxID=2604091 RepID=UPI0012644670|nr:porin family protein [Marinobacter changyiensis]
MKTTISAVVLTGLIITPAFAGTPDTSYAGLQYAHSMYEDDSGFETEPGAVVGRIGHFLNEFVAIELRAGFGISDGDIELDGSDTGADSEIDALYGIYFAGHVPITGRFSVYGLLGYSGGEATVDYGPSGSESENDSDFSFGAGVELGITPAVSGTLEYVSYFSESDYDIEALSVGLNYHY